MRAKFSAGMLLFLALGAGCLLLSKQANPRDEVPVISSAQAVGNQQASRSSLGAPRAVADRRPASAPLNAPKVATALAAAANPAATAPPSDDGRLTESTLNQISALEAEKNARTATQRKVDSQLLYADKMRRGQPIAEGVPALNVELDEDTAGRVLVDISATVSDPLLDSIRSAGGQIVNAFAEYSAIRAWVALDQTLPLAERPDVTFIQPAVRAINNSGSVTSEGDVAHKANLIRTSSGIIGSGVKVAVLSDSVDFLAESQASGDLPNNLTVLTGQSGVPASGEGTAMLEIVHDIAPGATLYYATAFNGPASFANNIRQLRAAGCDIIIDDVAYFNESPFQDGIIAQAVNDVTAAGALFFSSAGNSGNKNDNESGVWEGDFVDSGQTSADGSKVHSFGAANYNSAITGGSASQTRVDVFWADPLGKSGNDYDIYVVNTTGNVIASSSNTQNGTQDPYESINKLEVGQRVVIAKYSGADRFLHLGTGRGRLSTNTGGQTKGHNSAADAFCVAAVSARNATTPFTTSFKVETFSSDGLRRIFFHPDGTPITPGNFSSTGGVVRQKPDIAAADGVKTTLPTDSGLNPFYGTSAAAPHAGALAALLKSANPTITTAEARALLTSKTLDIEGTGTDRDAGYGLLMADLLIGSVPPSGAPSITSFNPAEGVAGTQVTISGSKFTGATSVKFNGVIATFAVDSASQISAQVPAGVSSGTISVTTPAGTATSTRSFTVVSAPVITSISPASGSSGTTVSIFGANLTGATNVYFGTRAASSFTVKSAQEITAVVPAGAITAKINVFSPAGNASSPGNFVISVSPVIVDFTPGTSPVGATVTVSGANFVNVNSVTFNGVAGSGLVVDSPSQLRINVPTGASSGPLRVVTAAGTAVGPRDFIVVALPAVTSVTPSSGPPGTVVTIAGTALTGASAVTFNGVAATVFSVASASQVIATVPANASTGPVRVTTPGGTATGQAFTVLTGPANDAFAAAQGITGASGTASGSTTAASREPGEPEHVGNPGGRSIWFSWAAPTSGPWKFDTVGSAFDTLLAVYTGNTLANLTSVAANDDIVLGVNTNSSVAFIATAGTVYRIAVDGFSQPGQNLPPASGSVVLNWAATAVQPAISGLSPASGTPGSTVAIAGANLTGATNVSIAGQVSTQFTVNSSSQITATVPSTPGSGVITVSTPGGVAVSAGSFTITASQNNDRFADAAPLTGQNGKANSSNANASKETGEPDHAGNSGGRSVWFNWNAPSSGVWTFDTTGSSFDTLLAVYTGTAINNLSAVAFNDDSGGLRSSRISFSAAQGTTYRIAVDGYGGDSGSVVLNWAFAPSLPSISGFSPASGAPGTSVQISGANLGGTVGVKFGSISSPAFTVNSGNQVTATVPELGDSAPITVITTNGSASSAANFVVLAPRPTNDDFANRAQITGQTATVLGSNFGATSQTGELDHAGQPGGKSVWWTWTAPAAGTYAVMTRGSGFDTLLGVYTGTTLNALVAVASSDDAINLETESRTTFDATAGTTYQIAVDGYDGSSGEIVLTIFPTVPPQSIYYTGFEESEGYSRNLTLAGQGGWQQVGVGDNGILFDEFFDGSNQAYLGYFSSQGGDSCYLWQPLDYSPNTNTTPVVVFSTFMEIVDSLNGSYDIFGWEAYNRQGDFLFGLDFDNLTMEINYVLDDNSSTPTGLSFENYQIMYLELIIDFGRKVWSATLEGRQLVSNQPISTLGYDLDLGDIDATWYRVDTGYGDNFMVFDDYFVSADPSHSPRIITPPQNQTVVAGAPVTLRVVADSFPELDYQWRLNGVAIPGANGPSFSLVRASAADAGSYTVVVSNYAGTVTSPAAILTVVQPPNLAPNLPSGWSAPLVVYATGGQTNAGAFTPDADVFVNWSAANVTAGGAPVGGFVNQLLVDGAVRQSWSAPGLAAGAAITVTNFNLGKMAAGTHTLRLEIDAAGAVEEAIETDNFYTRELVIVSATTSAPFLTSPVRLPDGNFRFTLNGLPSRQYEIQASTNLPFWSVLGQPLQADAAGIGVVTDLSATNSPRKLYRGKLLP